MKPTALIVRPKLKKNQRERLVKTGRVPIGYSKLPSLAGLSHPEIVKEVKKAYKNQGKTISRQLHNFASAETGTVILYPSAEDRQAIHGLQVKNGYGKNGKEGAIDAHFLDCEYLKEARKDEFSDSLQRAIVAAKRLVTNFSHYLDDIDAVLKGESQNGKNPSQNLIPQRLLSVLNEINKFDEENKEAEYQEMEKCGFNQELYDLKQEEQAGTDYQLENLNKGKYLIKILLDELNLTPYNQ